jgi:zeta-carotene desaturase
LSGLLGFTALPFKDRLQLVRVAKELLSTSPEKELVLDQMTVEEWLNQLGQSEISKKYLWNVITVGAMNNTSKNVSALMLFRILRAAFLQKKDNASLFIPRTGLSELLVNPAIQFIEARGGVVQTGVAVKRLLANGTHMTSVQTTDQRELQAPSFISTVPWYSFEEILSASEYPSQRADKNISERERSTVFTSSPIISLHLWLDREITTLDFAALLETRIQWLFNKWTLLHKDKCEADIRQYLSLVISGAEEFIRLPKEELVGMAMEDLRRVLPRAHEAKVIRSLVVKEKRATFIPGPGLEKIRPGAKTQFDNLFLAGDWTATGYPATIEGAVMSGKTAADMLG